MKVIERYIFWRVLSVFGAALGWSLAIVWTTQVLAKIDIVTDSGQTALTFFEIATLVLPTVIPLVIPFALVIGIAQTLATMNTDSELAVISAAGASRMIVIKPVMLIALIASAGSFLVDNVVEPFARVRNRELIAESRGDLISLVIQEGAFRKVEEGLFIQVGERLADGNLGQIFVADSREKNIDMIYYAKTGSVIKVDGANQLLMFDGVVNRKEIGKDVSLIRFASYAFDLGGFQAANKEITLLPKDRTLPWLMNPPATDRIQQKTPQIYRAEMHRRLTEWTFPLVFALIALAVAGDARSHRQARIHPLITTGAISLFWWWLSFFSSDQAETRPSLIYAMYGLPLLSAAISIWSIMRDRNLEPPVSVIEWLAARWRSVSQLASRWLPTGKTSGGAA